MKLRRSIFFQTKNISIPLSQADAETIEPPVNIIKRVMQEIRKDLTDSSISTEHINSKIRAVVELIKNNFYAPHFRSKENWQFGVDVLKELSTINSKEVRDALKFKYENTGHSLAEYDQIIKEILGEEEGSAIIKDLYALSNTLKMAGKTKIVFINATFNGGGVAEMFQTAGPILNELGIDVEWHVIYPHDPAFYDITKSIHNAIQGKDKVLSEADFQLWQKVNQNNTEILSGIFEDEQVARIFIEDPQVIHLIKYIKNMTDTPLSWRAHIDIRGILMHHQGAEMIWDNMKKDLSLLTPRDSVLFQPNLTPVDFKAMGTQYPGVDLLNQKNSPVAQQELESRIEAINRSCETTIDINKPYIVTGSRFDYWKGLVPALRSFEAIAADFPDVNLIVFGGYADDDPEGVSHYNLLVKLIEQSRFKDRIELVYNHRGRDIGALYRLAAIHSMPFLAPSLAEGYNLMTDEASLQGTVPFSSLVGGLGRYESILDNTWYTDLRDLTAKIEDASKLYQLNNIDEYPDTLLNVSSQAQVIEQRLTDSLNKILSKRSSAPDSYFSDYSSAAVEAKKLAVRFSLISMLRNYLALAAAGQIQPNNFTFIPGALVDVLEHEVAESAAPPNPTD